MSEKPIGYLHIDGAFHAVMPAAEPWSGHKFKEVRRGIWRCECGKTLVENTQCNVSCGTTPSNACAGIGGSKESVGTSTDSPIEADSAELKNCKWPVCICGPKECRENAKAEGSAS